MLGVSFANAESIRNITVDGQFNDWLSIPSYSDSVDDQHDTDHDGQSDTPVHVTHDDVDVLEYKFTHDSENLYAYFRARGAIGRTQTQAAGRAGRYYAIVTIDVDNDDSTGYWLHEGGYYPTSRGYDMNMELEFFDGSWNTGHYLSHDALDDAGENQDNLALTSGQWNGVSDGPYTPGTVTPAPGNYPNYTQWVYHDNDTLTLVRDKGPIVPGIMSMAISPDGHEIEFRAPFKGFLKDINGNANIALGRTIDISMSLEASGELFATSGNGEWASDTATPIVGYTLDFPGVPGDFNDNGTVDAADYVVWRNGDSPDDTQAGYDMWRAHFGQSTASASGTSSNTAVPEPSAIMLLIIALAAVRPRRRQSA